MIVKGQLAREWIKSGICEISDVSGIAWETTLVYLVSPSLIHSPEKATLVKWEAFR